VEWLYVVESMILSDIARAADLADKYSDFPLGTTDACVVALAECLDLARVATLDTRHFSVVRPRHVTSFALLP
jgi:uncharacterized protein